jgi:hypothetical protein
MAKNLKDILGEVADPKGGDEKAFKDKHIVQDTAYPAKDTDNVLNARKAKKDKTKRTHVSKDEEEVAYEEFNISSLMSVVEEILKEEEFIGELEEGILEDIRTISEGEDESFIELKDGTEIEVDPETASAITDVVEFLNDANRDKFLERLEKDQESFLRMVDFAVSMRGE